MIRSMPGCRSCGADGLELILSLGRTPIANALLSREQLLLPEPRYPLDLAFCPSCSLVQITETVPAELLGDHLYVLPFSDARLRHVQALAERLTAERHLDQESLVVELAGNDGYLLQHYQHKGVPVLGIEPAANVTRVAVKERGVPTLCECFGRRTGERLRAEGQTADVVHAHNVLDHVADLNDFVGGMHAVLKQTGVVIVEVPYLRDLVEGCEFDTIYHEHLCYFSLTALVQLFRRHGLRVQDVARAGLHGDSLQLTIGTLAGTDPTPAVGQLVAEEAAWGVYDVATYRQFGARVDGLKRSLTAMLHDLKSRGERIAGYGATAKGSTLLNYFGIGKDVLDFVVDWSPQKQGRYMPGVHLPISAPERLLEEMPENVLLLTWSFKDAILEQHKIYRQLGGRFIIPVPEVKVA